MDVGFRQPFPDMLLVFVPVPENKTVKDRIHLDVSAIGCDQDTRWSAS
jgi:hypothetical protein